MTQEGSAMILTTDQMQARTPLEHTNTPPEQAESKVDGRDRAGSHAVMQSNKEELKDKE